ncbi:MAG: DNA-protecting protein DprA [Clostridiales bacterium]|nr:DNA-protecting protein DprA [Clostridiales bacterium]
MKYTNSELCLLWLDSFIGLDYKSKREIFNLINGKSEIRSVLKSEEQSIVALIGENQFRTLITSAQNEYFQYVLDGLNKREITAITIESEGYPETLMNTPCPPLVLYVKGDESILSQECFSIVGSRKCLPLSISLAERYTESIIDAGFVPVTGIAEGVDSAVLQKAIEKGAKVISVIAGGFDNIYPKSNTDLMEKVAEVGVVISEHPPEVKPMPFHFPIRNRIIAGLSVGTLVVSAGIKSGTMHTAEYAVEYGKDLFAIPYSVGVASGAGCNELIKSGAILTDSPDDLLEFYNKSVKEKTELSLTEEEKEIVTALSDGQKHIEKLAVITGKQAYILTPLLSVLEIKGVVVRSGNIYGLNRNDLEA